MSFDAKKYLEYVKEQTAKIEVIKSKECIMDYDEKTKLINSLAQGIEAYVQVTGTLIASGALGKNKDLEI